MKISAALKPPFIALFYLALALALHFMWLQRGGASFGNFLWGGLILATGFGVMTWAWRLFRVKGTSVCPFEESTHFVQEGPYRFTRNPMYLGMTLILLGVSFSAGTPPVFLAPLAFFLTIHLLFIPYEEAKMERTFGEKYLDFKRRVRRWI